MDKIEGFLEVGHTEDTHEVVINHPDLKPDEHGVGHIVFSPAQARNLAMLLMRHANEAQGKSAEVSSFQVFDELCSRNSQAVRLAPLGNIGNMNKNKHGTLVEIGVGFDCIGGILNNEFVGGLILCDKAEFTKVRKEMEAKS